MERLYELSIATGDDAEREAVLHDADQELVDPAVPGRRHRRLTAMPVDIVRLG